VNHMALNINSRFEAFMVRIASTETLRAGDAFFLSVPPDLGRTYSPEAPKQST
jgi:hypothetical protein